MEKKKITCGYCKEKIKKGSKSCSHCGKKFGQKKNVKNICKNWGIGLIIAGLIPFLIPGIFSVGFGIFALLLGVATLIFRTKWILAVIGGVIILLGAWNIGTTLLFFELDFFLILGIIQVLIGVSLLNEYHSL